MCAAAWIALFDKPMTPPRPGKNDNFLNITLITDPYINSWRPWNYSLILFGQVHRHSALSRIQFETGMDKWFCSISCPEELQQASMLACMP